VSPKLPRRYQIRPFFTFPLLPHPASAPGRRSRAIYDGGRLYLIRQTPAQRAVYRYTTLEAQPMISWWYIVADASSSSRNICTVLRIVPFPYACLFYAHSFEFAPVLALPPCTSSFCAAILEPSAPLHYSLLTTASNYLVQVQVQVHPNAHLYLQLLCSHYQPPPYKWIRLYLQPRPSLLLNADSPMPSRLRLESHPATPTPHLLRHNRPPPHFPSYYSAYSKRKAPGEFCEAHLSPLDHFYKTLLEY
jgi:hypothetical protein